MMVREGFENIDDPRDMVEDASESFDVRALFADLEDTAYVLFSVAPAAADRDNTR